MNLLTDNPKKVFFRFLVPAVSSAVAVAIYSFVDTIVIGQDMGPNGTAACAVLLPVFTLASFIALLFGVGGAVLMSKARGEGNREKGDAYFTASLVAAGIITLVLWIAGMLFQKPLYRLCGADDVLLPYVYEYGRWIFATYPTFVFVTLLGSFVRTDGAPRFVMIVTLIGGIFNIIGDIVFVFPCKMGMNGAALATAGGSVLQTVILLVYILLGKTSLHLAKPHQWLQAIKKITVVGFGAGFSQIAMAVVAFVINNQIMKYAGASALAVYGFLGTVSALFLSVFAGIGQAAQPLVSENYGAGQHKRCFEVGKLGIITAVVFGIVSFALCALFPSQMVNIFMQPTPEVENIAPFIIRVCALSFLPMAINMFVMAYLQSVGKANSATLISTLRGMVLPIILLYLLPYLWGSNGIWWAVTASDALAAVPAAALIVGQLRKKKTGEKQCQLQ